MRCSLATLILLVPLLAAADPVPGAPVEPAPVTPDTPATPEPAPDPEPAPVTPTPAPQPDVVDRESTLEAQPAVRASADMSYSSGGSSGSPRMMAANELLLPKGNLEVGGDMIFITSDVPTPVLKFTDIGLVALHGRYSFGKVEAGLGVSFLIKQPSESDEPVFQGGAFDLRYGFKRRYAVGIRGAGGPMTGDAGLWGTADLGLQAKKAIHETVIFQGGLAASYTRLAFDGRRDGWFTEAVVGGSTVVRTPRGEVGLSVGVNLHVPVAYGPHMDDGLSYFINPQTRLSFTTAFAFSIVPQWDLLVSYTVVDRGDFDAPETMLPILDGGFDQVDYVFSLVHRFEKKKRRRTYYIAE